MAQQSLPKPGHSPLWAAGHCSAELQAQSGQGALQEHSPRSGHGAGLAAQLGKGAPCPPTGRFGGMGQGLPRNPLACLSSHLFAIANLAFAKMLDAKQNQCIIIR